MFVKLGRAAQIVILCSLLLAAPAAKPANATAPTELSFTVVSVYQLGIYSTTLGSWTSSGVIESAGGIAESVSFSGWNEYWWFLKNVHSEILLSDDHGTITIKAQGHQDMFEPFGRFAYTGTWVITEGTGQYAGLQGQGALVHTGRFHEFCPENAYEVTGPCLIETKTFTGQVHFDPQ